MINLHQYRAARAHHLISTVLVPWVLIEHQLQALHEHSSALVLVQVPDFLSLGPPMQKGGDSNVEKI